MRDQPEIAAHPSQIVAVNHDPNEIVLLGQGAHGIVYLSVARRRNGDEHQVAIKELQGAVATDDGRIMRNFRREARILSGLSHPNIVRFYGQWRFPVQTATVRILPPHPNAILMEYASSGSLAQLLERCRDPERPERMTWTQRIQFLRDISAGLAYLNDQNIVHRDLKPQNVLLEGRGTGVLSAKLTDFGLSRTLESIAGISTRSLLEGTPSYLAPEIAPMEKVGKNGLFHYGKIQFPC